MTGLQATGEASIEAVSAAWSEHGVDLFASVEDAVRAVGGALATHAEAMLSCRVHSPCLMWISASSCQC